MTFSSLTLLKALERSEYERRCLEVRLRVLERELAWRRREELYATLGGSGWATAPGVSHSRQSGQRADRGNQAPAPHLPRFRRVLEGDDGE